MVFFNISLINSQTVRLETGISVTRLEWKLQYFEPAYNKEIIGHAVNLCYFPINYKYFNIGIALGTTRKGGKSKWIMFDDRANYLGTFYRSDHIDYMSIGLKVCLKYPIFNILIPEISIKPRLDYAYSKNKVFDNLKEMKKYNYGINIGTGILFQTKRIGYGFGYEYNFNMIKIAKWSSSPGRNSGSIDDKTYSINFLISYNLHDNKN